jgi:hypothetical protein
MMQGIWDTMLEACAAAVFMNRFGAAAAAVVVPQVPCGVQAHQQLHILKRQQITSSSRSSSSHRIRQQASCSSSSSHPCTSYNGNYGKHGQRYVLLVE